MTEVYFRLTPTEKRMLDLLSDGKDHTRKELHGCLDDELSHIATIQKYLSMLRSSLQKVGHDIVCITGGGPLRYRHVVTLTGEESQKVRDLLKL